MRPYSCEDGLLCQQGPIEEKRKDISNKRLFLGWMGELVGAQRRRRRRSSLNFDSEKCWLGLLENDTFHSSVSHN